MCVCVCIYIYIYIWLYHGSSQPDMVSVTWVPQMTWFKRCEVFVTVTEKSTFTSTMTQNINITINHQFN